MPSKRSLFARHPFKFLFMTWFLASLPFRLGAIALYYLPPATRPSRTFQQALATKLLYFFFKFATAIEYCTPKSLEPGAEKARFVLIDPDEISANPTCSAPYTGPLTTNPAIKPSKIAAFWYEAAPPPDKAPPPLVVLHFHAGAFVLGGARTEMEAGWGPVTLSKQLGCPVLMPEYRLSNRHDRATAFPAAFQDAVTVYTYILHTLRIAPSNIVLSGDSAGGNIVLALLRYLSDPDLQITHHLPPPRAALLWSPWADLTTPGAAIDAHRNASADFISGAFCDWAVTSFIPDGWDTDYPYYGYISPLGHELRTSVPIFMHTSKAEVLYDSHVALARELEDAGCHIEFVEIEYAPHDAFLGGEFMGFREVMIGVIERAKRFVGGVGSE
ncbi:Alpha/Beta hydrolase protein [Aspergillus granulosus]|uniref:Alpha/Beta hydrolase protein n=1 Tax=Aspergillus granulosus TaxID=176169 RepID=A0ABR4I3Z1_9EURO